jgi:hypothetical protein
MSITGIRMFDRERQRFVVVDLEKKTAWADKDHDGKVLAEEKLTGADLERALRGAAQIDDLFVSAVPGTRTPDDAFDVAGVASKSELAALHAGKSVDATRGELKMHLDFFDKSGNEKASPKEVYEGFRATGFGPVNAAVKTGLVAVLFGKMKDGFDVDIAQIAVHRYASSTGIYDKNGRIDEAKLTSYLAAFDAKGGTLTHDEVIALLNEKGAGTVSKGQFKSLFTVCKKMNGDDTVNKTQFRGLFDGSLLWQAASVTDSEGHRKL